MATSTIDLRTFLSPPKEASWPSAVTPDSPYFPSRANARLLSSSAARPVLDVPETWNLRRVALCPWRPSLGAAFSTSPAARRVWCFGSFSRLRRIPPRGTPRLLCSSVDGRLGRSSLLATVHSAAMSVRVQVCVWTRFSFLSQAPGGDVLAALGLQV